MQRKACHRFADKMGWTIVHEEQEDGVSGHKIRAENRDKIQATAVVDKYSDDGHTVEDAVIREINLEILRRALKTLTDDELKIVRSLYLDDNPMSERQLSRIMDIPVTTLDYRKKQVLKKLKNFFEKT